jgi:tungstate transport system ATP-binding protein
MQDSAVVYALPSARIETGHGALPIRLENVGFAAGDVRILDGMNIELNGRAPTVVMGPNGSGKTTLLKLGMGLLAPTTGRITFDGDASAAPGSRAIVFQKPVMLRRTAAANIAFALAAAGRPASRPEIARLLDLAGIGALADRPARRLSGGEQQRLALARALARRPQVLFLDEPTASLDPAATKLVEDIVARVSAAGVKIVMSTHDLGQARRLAHEVVFLVGGRLVEHAPASRFFNEPATEEARRFLAGDLVV